MTALCVKCGSMSLKNSVSVRTKASTKADLTESGGPVNKAYRNNAFIYLMARILRYGMHEKLPTATSELCMRYYLVRDHTTLVVVEVVIVVILWSIE